MPQVEQINGDSVWKTLLCDCNGKTSRILIFQVCVFFLCLFLQGKSGNDAYKRRGGAKVSSSDRYQIWIWFPSKKNWHMETFGNCCSVLENLWPIYLFLKSCNNMFMMRHDAKLLGLLPFSNSGRSWRLRAKCTTAEVCWSPVGETCATAWMWTAWAASTPVPNAALASVASSAAVTGSGFMSRWKWRGARSSGTSSQANWRGKKIEMVLGVQCVEELASGVNVKVSFLY